MDAALALDKMKKWMLIVASLNTTVLFSQNFNGGLIAGISTSQVSGDNLGGYNKAGIFIGGFTEYPITKISNIKVEINYIQKGSNNPKMIENNISDISTSYIEVPLGINYYQNELMIFETGLQSAILIGSTDNDIYGKVSSDINRPFNKIDFSAFIGISYHLNKNIQLNTRFSNSILPIRDHLSGATYLLNKGQYNTVLTFTIHYYLS